MSYYKMINGIRIPISKRTDIMLNSNISNEAKIAMIGSLPTQEHISVIVKNAYRTVNSNKVRRTNFK